MLLPYELRATGVLNVGLIHTFFSTGWQKITNDNILMKLFGGSIKDTTNLGLLLQAGPHVKNSFQ
jgi:hypothetical protein